MTMDIVDRLRAMGGFLNESDSELDKVEMADIAGLIQSNRDLISAQFKEITRLTALVESYKVDAERYRWLRETSRDPNEGVPYCVITTEFLDKGEPAKMVSYLKFDEYLDADIDAAMKGKG